MNDINLTGVLWWPHSGGRWLSRSILGQHPGVFGTTFVHPWIFVSTDMIMELDITAQVHKAKSLPELNYHLKALTSSTEKGREVGIQEYFNYIKKNYIDKSSSKTHIVGEMCMGSPVPRAPDLECLFKACPELKLIHLVRNPISSYPSFAIRNEMDADPVDRKSVV